MKIEQILQRVKDEWVEKNEEDFFCSSFCECEKCQRLTQELTNDITKKYYETM